MNTHVHRRVTHAGRCALHCDGIAVMMHYVAAAEAGTGTDCGRLLDSAMAATPQLPLVHCPVPTLRSSCSCAVVHQRPSARVVSCPSTMTRHHHHHPLSALCRVDIDTAGQRSSLVEPALACVSVTAPPWPPTCRCAAASGLPQPTRAEPSAASRSSRRPPPCPSSSTKRPHSSSRTMRPRLLGRRLPPVSTSTRCSTAMRSRARCSTRPHGPSSRTSSQATTLPSSHVQPHNTQPAGCTCRAAAVHPPSPLTSAAFLCLDWLLRWTDRQRQDAHDAG